MAINITKPTVGGSEDTWGDTINTALDTIVTQVNATSAVSINAGSGLTGGGTLEADRTISHADTSSQASVNNSGNTFIQDITLDGYGHITQITSASVSETTPTFYYYDADATTSTAIDAGESIRFDDGIGIDVQWTDTSAPSFELEFNLKTDRRHNANLDVYTGNTDDFIKFDASHGIRFYTATTEDMLLTDAGDLHVDGDIIAYSTTVPSDQRLKDNIEPITGALDKVSQLGGYTFTYKEDGKLSAGVIAQEVEKILPSAVTDQSSVFNGKEGQTYKAVQYDQLHGLLIEAIKELKAEIEALKNGG